MALRDWRDGLLLGTGLGAIILGVGGRIAMRFAAIAVEQDLTFSMGGSAYVVLAGAVTGGAVAAGYLGIGAIPRIGRAMQLMIFWVGSVALMLAILSPVNARRLQLFVPLTITFVACLQLLWARRLRR